MTFNNICKLSDEQFTLEEKYVLGIAQPDEYTECIIKALTIAMTKRIGYATQLAEIHPELAHAVNCLLNGNLLEVYRQRKERQKKALQELGY